MSGGFVWHVFAIWVRVWRFGFKDARQPDRAGHPGAPGPGRARPLRARPRTADLGDLCPLSRRAGRGRPVAAPLLRSAVRRIRAWYVWPRASASRSLPLKTARTRGSRVGRAHRTAGRERHGRADDHERLFPDDRRNTKVPPRPRFRQGAGDRLPRRGGAYSVQTKLRLTSDETDNELKTLTRLRTNLRPPTSGLTKRLRSNPRLAARSRCDPTRYMARASRP